MSDVTVKETGEITGRPPTVPPAARVQIAEAMNETPHGRRMHVAEVLGGRHGVSTRRIYQIWAEEREASKSREVGA